MGVPMGMIRAPGILRTPELCNHRADSLQIKFIGIVLACRCATPWSFAHQGIMGMPMGMIRAPGVLRTLELCNHWADSPQIKFFGTFLACRHATSGSFAHLGLMGVITLGTLFTGWGTLQWSACYYSCCVVRVATGDGTQQPCLTIWMSLGLPKLSVMCASLWLAVIFMRIMIHMHAACRVLEGRKSCRREYNCIACSSWDDLAWDVYEANLAKKEKIRERKPQKAAEWSASVLSEDSVNMFPDSAEEDRMKMRLPGTGRHQMRGTEVVTVHLCWGWLSWETVNRKQESCWVWLLWELVDRLPSCWDRFLWEPFDCGHKPCWGWFFWELSGGDIGMVSVRVSMHPSVRGFWSLSWKFITQLISNLVYAF